MSSHPSRRAARILTFNRFASKRAHSHRGGSTARRRSALGFRPRLDHLETRQMLSTSAVMGPMPSLETLNVQLKSGPGGSLRS